MPVPSTLALTVIADGAPITAAPIRNDFAAIQTAVNAVIGFVAAGNSGSILKWNGTDWTFTTNVTIDDSVGTVTANSRVLVNMGQTSDKQVYIGQDVFLLPVPAITLGADTSISRLSAGILGLNGGLTMANGDLSMTYDASVANATALLLTKNGGGLRRVEYGAADSGAAGFRMLRIAN